MKTTLYTFILILLLCLCNSCSTIKYIPVETVKTEYHNNYLRDSIFRYDSIFVKEKGDTVFMERYRYLYRDKIVRDSIFVSDTIRIPYPVEVTKEVKKPLSGWQNFQVWCGRMALAVLLLIVMYFVFTLKKRLF